MHITPHQVAAALTDRICPNCDDVIAPDLTARLEIVDVVASNRADVFSALARGAINAAVDQAAEHMVISMRNRTLADFGFRPIGASGDSTLECAEALIDPTELELNSGTTGPCEQNRVRRSRLPSAD